MHRVLGPVLVLLLFTPAAFAAPLGLKMRSRKRPSPRLELVSAELLELTIARDGKQLKLLAQKKVRLKKAKALPRFRGRFAVQLFSHKRLREVVPFSFPLTLAAGEPNLYNRRLSRQMSEGVRATTKVKIPFTADLTHLVLLDASGAKTRHVLRKAVPLPQKLPGPRRTDSLGK